MATKVPCSFHFITLPCKSQMSPSNLHARAKRKHISSARMLVVLLLRDLPACHPGNCFLPYGLAGLILGLIMLALLLLFAWWLTHRRGTGSAGKHRAPRMSTDTTSPPYPDRPIRPLPKRRLRERLSPEAAGSIQYPAAPQSASTLFSFPYGRKYEESKKSAGSGAGEGRRNGFDSESEEEELELVQLMDRAVHRPDDPLPKPKPKQHTPQAPPSATSSADGYYDPFEMSNNKKKRKIPTAGDTLLSLTAHVVSSVGSSPSLGRFVEGQAESVVPTSNPYYGSGSFASGNPLCGPGRGRFGRLRSAQVGSQTGENTGIISNAIANAEKIPFQQGQENVSLLQQQQSVKSSPAVTQFTFTCDSQVPGATVSWPISDHVPTPSVPRHPASARSNQTGTAPLGQAGQKGSSKTSRAGQTQAGAPEKKTRKRSTAREYILAAKARRRQAEYQNMHNPPKPEDIWICEFCEYEAIFGHPPEALVRQYEIKDRKLRQQEEERRRLLEKAKMRARKGKKGKAPAKNNTPTADRNPPQGGTNAPPINNHHGQGNESEDYYNEDDCDDGDYEYVAAEELHGRAIAHRPLRPPEVVPAQPGPGPGVRQPRV